MLGLRPKLRVVRLVKTAMSVAGKGHCRLKPRMSRRRSVPLAVQICPGNLHQLVNTPPPGCCALRVFQSEHTVAEPAQQLHRAHASHQPPPRQGWTEGHRARAMKGTTAQADLPWGELRQLVVMPPLLHVLSCSVKQAAAFPEQQLCAWHLIQKSD